MEASSFLTFSLGVWLIAALVTTHVHGRRTNGGVGLVFAYVLNFWALHWIAASLYLLPWYRYHDDYFVTLGVEQSTYGMVAFACGSLGLAPFVTHLGPFRRLRRFSYSPHPALPAVYLLAGAGSYLLLSSTVGSLPTANALISVGQYLFVVGLCLQCWVSWRQRAEHKFIFWLSVAFILPFVTILSRGFMGYGAAATLVVCTFVASFLRPLWKVTVVGVFLMYLGFSFYVNYMRDRDEIRASVWGQQSLFSRVDRIATTLRNFEWFNPYSERHLQRIDDRLNQNIFVGAAVDQLNGSQAYTYGETLSQALLALVPRVLWPEKPVFGGSGNLVREYTGFRFSEGTSVGVGQVLEFYINFGTLGVVVGFLIFGVVVTLIDVIAARQLLANNWQGFVLWYLVGISCLQIGGSLVEVVGSAGASVVVAVLLNRFILTRLQKQPARPRPFFSTPPATTSQAAPKYE